MSPAEATCVHSPGSPAFSPGEAICVHSSGRPVLLHSSASSLPGAASSTMPLLSTSISSTPDQSSPDPKAQSQSSSRYGLDPLHTAQLTQQSSNIVGDGWVSLEKKTAGCEAQQAAAYSLLCDPRKPTGHRDSDQPSSSNMDCVPEISEGEDQEEEETRQSNMQSLIQKATALQVSGRMGCMMTLSIHFYLLWTSSGEMTDNDRETNTSRSLFGVSPDETHSI